MFPLGGEDTADIALLLTVVAVAALAIGDARGLRGEAIAERDASRRQVAESMREQAAMEERTRIARELHDVVAHHVSMIAVQAEAASLTTPDLPQEGRQRFGDIAKSAREALAEMRRLLGVFREDAGGGGERRPQPGLDRLQELIDDARATGTPVRLTLRGPVVPLGARRRPGRLPDSAGSIDERPAARLRCQRGGRSPIRAAHTSPARTR
jgi:signal transduction histidine kinase